MKKIAVLGSGANGASIGADLTKAGHDVVLIDQWPENVAAMRTEGLRIVMPGEALFVPVRAYNLCDVCTFTEPFDIVLLLVKAYDSIWASHLIAPYLKEDGLICGVQNGMTVESIAKVVGPERTMGSVIEISSSMFVPGTVNRDSGHDRSWFAVGSVDPRTSGREEEIAGLLRHSGSVEIVDNILATKWMKLVSNATTLVTTALFGISMQEAAAVPAMREVMLRSGQEALDIGASLGFPSLPIFGLRLEDISGSNRVVETLLDVLLAGFTLPTTKTTVLQDWTKGRRSEVDDLNGLVAEMAEQSGTSAPVNKAVTRVAHEIEKGTRKPSPDNLDYLMKLIAIS